MQSILLFIVPSLLSIIYLQPHISYKINLGLRKHCGAFDYNLGCSGYIYGLAMAKSFINSKLASNVLLVTAEAYSKHIHIKDVTNRAIFGDGATATLIKTSNVSQIGEFNLGSDGSGAENLIVKGGGGKAGFQNSFKTGRETFYERA
jgi:3-oxoacyl-[acyl-carrier-protein] synthase III